MKKKPARKATRKTSKVSNTRSIVKLIKNVTLKTQETKTAYQTTTIISQFHNLSLLARVNLMSTTQGITDGLSVANRLGDTVTPIGVKLYMGFRQASDRPNVTWKVWIVKHWGSTTPPSSVPVKAITGNLLLDPIDTEKCSAVLVKTFKNPDNYFNGTLGNSRETCFFKKLWIPLPRVPYVYGQDGGNSGKKYQLSMYVTAYDTLGTLITDQLGSFEISSMFYFKDA